MKIELFSVPECPHRAGALQLIREILAGEKIDAEVAEILVADQATAERIQFLGSPTIRINGCDIDQGAASNHSYGLTCRLYPGSRELGLPSADRLREAILENVSRGI